MKLITLGCLGTLELVPLGCLGALDGWCYRGAQEFLCKAPGKLRGLQVSCGDFPEQFVWVLVTAPRVAKVYGFGDRPQGLPFVWVR